MKQPSRIQLAFGATITLIAVGSIIYGVILAMHKKAPSPNQFSIPTPMPVPKKVTDLINIVNQQTSLPSNETPSVATVTDINKLPKQPFFAQAQNGDKVLIYATQKKAYLFRPSTKQIIQTAIVEIDNSPDASSSAAIATNSAQTANILKIRY